MLIAIVFAVLAVICAIGWLTMHISTGMLIWYLQKKGIPLPSSEEMKEGSRWVVQHLIGDLLGRKR